ncbi:STK36-like protein [Mya arenaria]|uniref:STK36-like protein n=1 Tax=Mya arenaria TaxID=6604 RepID=A0ABY7E1Z9_MYAAR|nr:STK36-like protein [Mya arenaria]
MVIYCSALGNLGLHSSLLSPQLKKCKVVQSLVYAACHDSQPGVQISALLALRTLSKQDDLKKEMSSSKTVDKLSELTSTTPRPSSATPRSNSSLVTSSLQSSRGHTSSSSVLTHCSKLIQLLQGHNT